eukprot:Sspe_Gene.27519::Locus_11914_Transcript_1_1_Confidence_1.000_Length_1934::g.27519::m.27519
MDGGEKCVSCPEPTTDVCLSCEHGFCMNHMFSHDCKNLQEVRRRRTVASETMLAHNDRGLRMVYFQRWVRFLHEATVRSQLKDLQVQLKLCQARRLEAEMQKAAQVSALAALEGQLEQRSKELEVQALTIAELREELAEHRSASRARLAMSQRVAKHDADTCELCGDPLTDECPTCGTIACMPHLISHNCDAIASRKRDRVVALELMAGHGDRGLLLVYFQRWCRYGRERRMRSELQQALALRHASELEKRALQRELDELRLQKAPPSVDAEMAKQEAAAARAELIALKAVNSRLEIELASERATTRALQAKLASRNMDGVVNRSDGGCEMCGDTEGLEECLTCGTNACIVHMLGHDCEAAYQRRRQRMLALEVMAGQGDRGLLMVYYQKWLRSTRECRQRKQVLHLKGEVKRLTARIADLEAVNMRLAAKASQVNRPASPAQSPRALTAPPASPPCLFDSPTALRGIGPLPPPPTPPAGVPSPRPPPHAAPPAARAPAPKGQPPPREAPKVSTDALFLEQLQLLVADHAREREPGTVARPLPSASLRTLSL